jgi:hypothetical protein
VMNFTSDLCLLWKLLCTLTDPRRGLLVTIHDVHRNHFYAKQTLFCAKYGVRKWHICIQFVAAMTSLVVMDTSKCLCYGSAY